MTTAFRQGRHGALCASRKGGRNAPGMSGLDRIRTDVVGSLLRPADWKRGAPSASRPGKLDAARVRAHRARVRARAPARCRRASASTSSATARSAGSTSRTASASRSSGYDAGSATVAGVRSERAAGRHAARALGHSRPRGAGTPVVHRRPVVKRLKLARNRRSRNTVARRRWRRSRLKVSLIGPDRIMQRFDHADSKAVYAERGRVRRRRGGDPAAMIAAAGGRRLPLRAHRRAGLHRLRRRAVDGRRCASAARTRCRTSRARCAAERRSSIADFPGVTFGIHLCRGNQRSMWHREGSYDAIAERLFNELPHQRFLLEYDSPRAGSFAPLRFVPKGKVVVLGLVSTKVPELESVDALVRRIDEAAKYVPLEQLADQPAVRLRLRRGRQSDQRGRPEAQARARGRGARTAKDMAMKENAAVRHLRLDRGVAERARAAEVYAAQARARRKRRTGRASTPT